VPIARVPGGRPKLAFTELFGPNIANKTEQWPTEDVLKAMSSNALANLRVTRSGWYIGRGVCAIEFAANDGKVSPKFGPNSITESKEFVNE